MARLILLASPVASAGTGIVIGLFVEWIIAQLIYAEADDAIEGPSTVSAVKEVKKAKTNRGAPEDALTFTEVYEQANDVYKKNRRGRQAVAIAAIAIYSTSASTLIKAFEDHAVSYAYAFASPKIVYKAQQRDGNYKIITDYLDSYKWLKDHTPQDSRVMAWWDYGYQITGIANRTTIADGNTWNHEHIATLGKCLTSPTNEAHSLIRHLADYVLVWAGGRGDDVMKSPHMARIGNSVYRDICPNDPACSQFGFYDSKHERPTPMMAKSLLYNLHSAGKRPGVSVDSSLFQEVHTSRNGLVRIYKVMNVSQESKDWLADPANRLCDKPGSWYCPGQYPPAPEIQNLLKNRIDFAQLEDFNRKKRT